jgi:hypothetical protein
MFGSRLARPEAVIRPMISGVVFHDAPFHTAYTTDNFDTLDLESRCVTCQRESRLTVRRVNYHAWLRRVLVQVAFPHLDRALREQFFQSGICGTCWDSMFALPKDN